MSMQRLQHSEYLCAILTLILVPFLVIKPVFRLTMLADQGFIYSIFSLMNIPLRYVDYSCFSKRARAANVSFKRPSGG